MKLNFKAVILVLATASIVTGCSSMKPYSESPQFNAATNTFQHPRGYRHDKGLLDVLGLARARVVRFSSHFNVNHVDILTL